MTDTYKKLLDDLEDLLIPIEQLKKKAIKVQDEKPNKIIQIIKKIIN